MRQLLPLWFLLATLSAVSQSNNYYPFPTGNCYWREVSDGYQCYQCCSEYQYILTGDTLIGDNIYSKIEHSGVLYSQDMWGNCTRNNPVTFRNYKGALRNDIENRKVLFVQPWTEFEEVLYDFNLEVGDTLPASIINPLCCGVGNMVTGIDSVLVGTEYHRCFHIASIFDPTPFCSIIEGVGSTFGLFGSMGAIVQPFESGSVLRCLCIDGETVYPDITPCELATGLDYQPLNDILTVFPNPAGDLVTITINRTSASSPFTISLLDLQGREWMKCKSSPEKFSMDLSRINRGIYILKVFDGKNSYYSRIIKN